MTAAPHTATGTIPAVDQPARARARSLLVGFWRVSRTPPAFTRIALARPSRVTSPTFAASPRSTRPRLTLSPPPLCLQLSRAVTPLLRYTYTATRVIPHRLLDIGYTHFG